MRLAIAAAPHAAGFLPARLKLVTTATGEEIHLPAQVLLRRAAAGWGHLATSSLRGATASVARAVKAGQRHKEQQAGSAPPELCKRSWTVRRALVTQWSETR